MFLPILLLHYSGGITADYQCPPYDGFGSQLSLVLSIPLIMTVIAVDPTTKHRHWKCSAQFRNSCKLNHHRFCH
jgi:hypothetical protein